MFNVSKGFWIYRTFNGLNLYGVWIFPLSNFNWKTVLYLFMSLFQPFDTIIEKLKRKGLKKGLLVVSFLSSTQQFHLDALNAVPEVKKTSPVKVSDMIKMIIIFYLDNAPNVFVLKKKSVMTNKCIFRYWLKSLMILWMLSHTSWS